MCKVYKMFRIVAKVFVAGESAVQCSTVLVSASPARRQ